MKRKSKLQKITEAIKIESAYKYDSENKVAKELHLSKSEVSKVLHNPKFNYIKENRLKADRISVPPNKKGGTNNLANHNHKNKLDKNLTNKEQKIKSQLNELDINELNINQINSLFFNKGKIHREFVQNHTEALMARLQELERTGKTTISNKHSIFSRLFHRK